MKKKHTFVPLPGKLGVSLPPSRRRSQGGGKLPIIFSTSSRAEREEEEWVSESMQKFEADNQPSSSSSTSLSQFELWKCSLSLSLSPPVGAQLNFLLVSLIGGRDKKVLHLLQQALLLPLPLLLLLLQQVSPHQRLPGLSCRPDA